MYKMTKKIACLALVALTIVFSACEAPDQEIFTGYTPEEIANSDNPAVVAVLKATAYSQIVGSWGGHNSLWSMHEVASDEMVIAHKGADWEDGGQWIRMHRHDYGATEESIGNAWNYCFTAVGEINLLIQQYPDVEALVAEMRVLRALVYLWLIDAYGNVPVITEDSVDPTPPTVSRADVFTFIESSIIDNIDKLPLTSENTTFNQTSARAILAKLYLNAEVYTGNARWADAETQIDAIINSGTYSLESNFFDNFKTDNAASTENILALPYDEDNAGGFNIAQMTGHYLTQETFRLEEQPWNGYASLEAFYNAYEDNDARKLGFLVGPQFAANGTRLLDISAEADDPDGEPLTFTPEINMLTPNSYRQAGARVGKFEFATGARQSLSNDFPIFRYGDILLMKAEVMMRGGNTAGALDFVNQVRQRAGADPLTTIDNDILLAERGREVFAEGYRRSDLIRFGRYNDAWWEKPASASTANIFPIPQGQRDVNADLIQNPGY